MNKTMNFLHKYLVMISLLIGVSILLGLSYSSFFVSSNDHKAAEMYIGELKYSMTIDNESKNTLTVPSGETIIDLTVNSLDPVDTYYKLLYLKNSNIEIKYYESTKDTDEIVTTYSKPNDSIVANNSNNIKLLIINNSETDQTIELVLKGGYITNTLSDISIPTNYNEITLIETPTNNTYFCMTSDTLKQGLKYTNGQYTYSYKQKGEYPSSTIAWSNMQSNGWGAQLSDKTSTDPVTSKVCAYINNKPITDASYMYYNSQAASIDLSGINTKNIIEMFEMFSNTKTTALDLSTFNTSKVTNMYRMFSGTTAQKLDLRTFDTSNVTNMYQMFRNSQATIINVSSFNTSNVTNMSGMFNHTEATTLDVSNFNTSKVTDMSNMFGYSKADTIDLSNFDTSNVVSMFWMFEQSQATTINVSNFNTSNVTNMGGMFRITKATNIDVSNFDTSKVTDMSEMFYSTVSPVLDVSNFDTSKVTKMYSMFEDTKATTLNISNFNTSNVTNMQLMFYGSTAPVLNVSSFDTSKVTRMAYMFNNTKATELDISNFDTSKVTDMQKMFYNNSKLKTIYVSNKFNTDNVTASNEMFRDSNYLVGGSGTKYNSSYVDKTYAKIDGGASNPGYFTDIEDKGIPSPNSFSTDSWETIARAAKKNNISKYNIGDTKTINMGTYGTHTIRIANTTRPIECDTTGFSQTACGFVLEFTDLITTHAMNSTETSNGGWPSMNLRTFLNNDILNSLPSDLQSVIISTQVVSGHNDTETTNYTSTDKLYLLSIQELFGDQSSGETAAALTRQLDYYKSVNTTSSNALPADKDRSSWWTRTVSLSYKNTFMMIDPFGLIASGSPTYQEGISPAFRIG